MLDPVIIIPENGNSPLLQQLNNIDVHDAMKSVIKGFQPQRITILPSSGNITIDCQIEPPPEPILCSQLGDLLKQVIPGATRVDLVLAPPVVTVPLSVEELLMDKLEDIQDFICCRIPSASGWLDLASLKIENDKIILEVMDEMAHKNMKERNVEAVLADFFRSHGHNLPISLQKRDGEVSREMMDQMYGAPSPVVLPQSANNSDSSSSSLPQSQGGYEQGGKNGGARGPRKSVFGQTIPGDKIVSIATVTVPDKIVIVEGHIFDIETKELVSKKNGNKFFKVSFILTDLTDSIKVEFLTDPELVPKLKNWQYFRVRGKTEENTYVQELILKPLAIQDAKPLLRTDLATEKRVELHAHSKMSSMDGLTNINEYVDLASHFGHPALSLTDHGIVQGFPEFYSCCKKKKIKPIFGMEGYLVNDDVVVKTTKVSRDDKSKQRPWHIVILAQNTTGLKNLYELISLSHLDHYFRKPRIPRSELTKRREGLVLGSACEAGELFQAVLAGQSDDELDAVAKYYDYLEIQPIGNNRFLLGRPGIDTENDLRNLNRKIDEIGRRLNIPVVATSDLHFLNPEDAVYRKILQAGQKYKDADIQPPLFFHTTDEMLDEFSYLGKERAKEVVVDTALQISNMIEDDLKPIPEIPALPELDGAKEDIRRLSYEKAEAMYSKNLPDNVKNRLEYELDCIIKNGFSTLYLIARKLVLKSNEDGYLVGSRGSVGSSFIATMLGITEVNPLDPHYRCPKCLYSEFLAQDGSLSGFDIPDKECPQCSTRLLKDGHSIPFATFLGINGDKVPDIDLNFSGEYQGIIHKYVEEIFGSDNVFRAGTISGIQTKTAHGFVMGWLGDKGENRRRPEKARLANGITGVKRTTGQHPGGVMIVPKGRNIHEFTPVNYPANDKKSSVVTTHFSYKAIHDVLLKLDLLGHDDPTFIRMLQDMTGIDVFNIPFDDKKTMSLFSSRDILHIPHGEIPELKLGSLGIPEFGTGFVQGMLSDTLPSTFAELVRISGLSHGTDVWLNNAQEIIKSKKAPLAQVISVRDDIINYLIGKGMDPTQAFFIMEDVRKGKGLTEEKEAAMREYKVPEWYIESCKKIKYMFPKAHAVAYVMMAFRIAYFKVNYKEAFYAVYFSTKGKAFSAGIVLKGINHVKAAMVAIDQKDKNDVTAKDLDLFSVLQIVEEAMARGVKFLPIDLYKSDAVNFLLLDNQLLCPFTSIDGLGENAARKIVEEREKGEFISIEDCKKRTGLSKTVIETLKSHNCFGDIPDSDQLELF